MIHRTASQPFTYDQACSSVSSSSQPFALRNAFNASSTERQTRKRETFFSSGSHQLSWLLLSIPKPGSKTLSARTAFVFLAHGYCLPIRKIQELAFNIPGYSTSFCVGKDFARQRTPSRDTTARGEADECGPRREAFCERRNFISNATRSIPKLKPDPYTMIRCTVYDHKESCPNSKIQRCSGVSVRRASSMRPEHKAPTLTCRRQRPRHTNRSMERIVPPLERQRLPLRRAMMTATWWERFVTVTGRDWKSLLRVAAHKRSLDQAHAQKRECGPRRERKQANPGWPR